MEKPLNKSLKEELSMNKRKSIAFLLGMLLAFGVSINFNLTVNAASVDGWIQEKGSWYYYENGYKVTNSWKLDSNGWCYLDSNGNWLSHATWAKDSTGWYYIDANGYWDKTVPGSATNPIEDATDAIGKAENSKLQSDINAAKALIAKLNDAVPEKAALNIIINSVHSGVTSTKVEVGLPVITGAENDGEYNTDRTITVTGATAIIMNDSLFASGSTISNEGSYKLMAVNSSGLTIINFVIDKTPPVVRPSASKNNNGNYLYLDIDAPATIEVIPGDYPSIYTWDGATAGDNVIYSEQTARSRGVTVKFKVTDKAGNQSVYKAMYMGGCYPQFAWNIM